MDCTICKVGSTEQGLITVTLERGETIVLIKKVPAQVCQNCGHYFLDSETTKLVMDRGNDAIGKGSELEILNLQLA
jgi:YgiT-type zinc finger domain-containing protein